MLSYKQQNGKSQIVEDGRLLTKGQVVAGSRDTISEVLDT
jgi:hypothetical protein